MKQRAGVYVRVSRDVEGEGLAVARQETDCLKLCADRGLDVVEVYTDNDLSAWSARKARPAYESLLADVRAGLVQVVVCWHPDRLHRSPKELEAFIDLVEAHGVDVLTVTSGDRDLTTADGRFRARIEGAVARKESDDKSRRLRRKHQELAELGKVSGGGPRPFGFEADRRTHRDDEVAVVREVARRVLAGESLYRIRGDLEARGVSTSTGAPWSTTALKTLLTGHRIVGLRNHPRVGLTDAEWEPVLDRETWEAVGAILNDPGRRRNPVVRRYLLSRMILCGLCGSELRAAPREGRRRGYGCTPRTGCGRLYALADPIEELVVERALAWADAAPTRELVADEETRRGELVAEALSEARQAEESLDALTRAHFVDRTVPARQFTAVSRELQSTIEAARARAAAMSGASVLGAHAGRVSEVWPELDLEQRRSVVAGVVSSITLRPWERGMKRTAFDPRRLAVVPRWSALLDFADGAVFSDDEAREEYLRLAREV